MVKKILLAAALFVSGTAIAQQMSDMTIAILNAYQKTLDENPEDYDTYYQRAVAYYQLSQYDKALADLKKAIEYTPAKNPEMLTREYSLRADVYQQLKDYDQALTAVDKALTISPKSYADLYKRGNLLIELGRNEEALSTYRQMLSLKTHSQEAFFGMAQASARMGNKAEAEQYMQEARRVDQTSPLTYARLGDVYRDLGESSTAVVSYLSSISLGGDLARPIGEILQIAQKDYPSYRKGMAYALEETKEAPMLTYIDARISSQVGAYEDAAKAMEKILAASDGRDASNLSQMARIKLALMDFDQARNLINEAIGLESSPERLLLKSEIELGSGHPAAAVLAASRAYNPAKSETEPLLAMARANIASSDAEAAMESLSEAALIDAEDPEIFLLRAYVNGEMLKNETAARTDLQRAAMGHDNSAQAIALKGIALFKLGRSEEAEKLVADNLLSPEGGITTEGIVNAAIYYSQTGDKNKSTELLEVARQRGYQDKYTMQGKSAPYTSIIK